MPSETVPNRVEVLFAGAAPVIIESLRMVNFRCHRDKFIEFSSGVTAIIGSNGAGKSTIFEAIVFGMTGSLDEKGKANAISVGEVSGHVIVKFKIGVGRGTVTRALHSSEVKLTYDGKEYRKASDVKELLESLLQINPDIFQRVIVARQGEIPLLFSGDSSVRTAIFQKIFMVPNTNNLRDVLWNDYIKKLPPPLPVEDMEALKQEKITANSTLSSLSVGYTPTKELVLNLNSIQARLKVVEKELRDARELQRIEGEIAELIQKFQDLKFEIDAVGLDTKELEAKIDALKLKKHKIDSTLKVLNKYGFDTVDDFSEHVTKLEDELYGNQKEREYLINARVPLQVELDQLKTVLKLEVGGCCPVCKSVVQDPVTLRTTCEKRRGELEKELSKIEVHIARFNSEIRRIKEFPELKVDFGSLENDLTFNQNLYDSYVDELNKIRNIQSTIRAQNELLVKLEYQKSQLTVTRSVEEINKSINLITADIVARQKKIEENSELESQIIGLQQTIKNLSDRMNTSTINKRKNDSSNELRETLLVMHDLFNPAVFAKRVIQKFTNIVTEYLEANTKQFNLPYAISVNEEFNIEVFDKNGYLIPKVSGGQEIIIGLCLRLSLLEIFAQNFGFMAIDEGTRCLDKENKAIFFNMIKNLNNSQFQQVFIIDHDNTLSEVTNQTIEL